MDADLKILSAAEFGLLLYHINQLRYKEAWPLEKELKEAYDVCHKKWSELEALAKRVRSKCTLEKSDDAKNDAIKVLIEILTGYSPVEFEKEILAGEPL